MTVGYCCKYTGEPMTLATYSVDSAVAGNVLWRVWLKTAIL